MRQQKNISSSALNGKHHRLITSKQNSQPGMPGKAVHCFTLIELLVVIAIIAILAAILLPALQQARARGIATDCIAKRKQVGVWTSIYTDTFNGWLMPWQWGGRGNDEKWWSALYLAKITPWNRLDKYYGCPAAPDGGANGTTQTNTLNINSRLTGMDAASGKPKHLFKINKVRNPGKKYLITDAIKGYYFDEGEYISSKISPKGTKTNGFYPWHDKNKSGTMLYADMRVELLRMQNLDIPHANNVFIGDKP